jgi:serine O-acetyltransferase
MFEIKFAKMSILTLKQLLYSDCARQSQLEGRLVARSGFVEFARRLLRPRFLPIVLLRASRAAMIGRIPLLPQVLTYLNLVLFGLEVSPRCEIGPGIFFPHPTGTVVGAWRIGSNVTIFQGVTLGARELDMNFDFRLRPDIGDHVVLGAGSKILGGVRIGDHSTVGANSVVVHSVEAGTTVVGNPARRVTSKRRRNIFETVEPPISK